MKRTRLADYLDETKQSKAEFSRAHGIPAPMLSQWSTGSRRPGLKYALELERITDGAIPAKYWTELEAESKPKRRRSWRSNQ